MKFRVLSVTLLITAIAFVGIYSSGLTAKTLPADVGPGRVAWFDITTTDLGKSKEFYGKLFGWTFNPVKGTDQAVEIAVGGTGIGTIRSADGKFTPFSGTVYIQVSDLPASCKKAEELGGKIPTGFPFNLPDDTGAIAVVLDPVGHPVGMYSRTSLSAPK
jgi:predicted enzyme related to lactoylglutathione lyase